MSKNAGTQRWEMSTWGTVSATVNLGGTAGSSLSMVTVISPISLDGLASVTLNFHVPGSSHETVTSAGAAPFIVLLNSAAGNVAAARSAVERMMIVFMAKKYISFPKRLST